MTFPAPTNHRSVRAPHALMALMLTLLLAATGCGSDEGGGER